jgi:hypothetical protein
MRAREEQMRQQNTANQQRAGVGRDGRANLTFRRANERQEEEEGDY